jgi:eukaryotic-like serine/threonine-protein kinase
MPATAAALDLLAAAGLLTPGQVREADRLRADVPAPAVLAARLYRRGLLTRFQARWVARGHGARLAVGPYVLVDRLGAGGMGEVFLARHARMRRPAALKMVRPDRERDPEAQARFAREIRAVGRLDHPHVAHAYDAGRDRGRFWLALDYVPGPDLGGLVRDRGPLDPRRACDYARQAALGLQHVHGAGLVHRDVKPSNLALDARGLVKVLDVGLAGGEVLRADGRGLTRAGFLVGSPDFAAPEQVEDARTAGPAADQYGLGAALYFLLTGTHPFPDGTAVQKALRRLTEDPAAVEGVRPGLPGAVGEVVRRLMARRPQDRFASAAEAAEALGAVAAGLPVVEPLPAEPVPGGTAEASAAGAGDTLVLPRPTPDPRPT